MWKLNCDLLMIVWVLFVCCVFFFKQKTAYEMRISDWSSDVCSSDLLEAGARLEQRHGLTAQREPNRVAALAVVQMPPALGGVVEIGRASGRERVCQYV